ncbi:MAG: hypothetical protein KF852_01665 [Saprospiraceae bacterium]|nr:hypothetical protein [Saprospiraceae bacterium]
MNRLLILTQYFPPEMGAPQSRLYETARGLQARGWEVEIITAFPNYPTGRIFPAYRGRFSMQEAMDGLNVRRYWLYASNSRKALPRIASMMSFSISVLAAVGQVRRFRPAYLWVESPPLLLGLSGWILARCSGARLALNISDIWPLSAAELGALKKGSLFYRLLEGLERFLYRRCSTILRSFRSSCPFTARCPPKYTKPWRRGCPSFLPAAAKARPSFGNTIWAGYMSRPILKPCRPG